VTENRNGEAADPQSESQPRSRWRRWVTPILIVVTSVTAVGAIVGVWIHETVLETDRFMSVIEPTLADGEFHQELGTWAGEQVVGVLDLEDRVADRLSALDDLLITAVVESLDTDDRLLQRLEDLSRPSLATLAPGIAGPLEERIVDRVVELVTSEAVAGSLPEIVERGHFGLAALARDELVDLPNVYVAGGDVRVNLLPLVGRTLGLIQEEMRNVLPDVSFPTSISERAEETLEDFRISIGASVPDDFGQVRLMSEANLATLQAYTRTFDRFVWAWVAFAVVLVALTVLVSTSRRRTAFHLLFGLAIALAISGLIFGYFEDVLVSAASGRDGALVAGFLIDVFGRLRLILTVFLVAAVAVAVTGYASGRRHRDGSV
jgi:hypothetical protein